MCVARPVWDKFIEKIDFNGSLILTTPCWEWAASKNSKGYGQLGNGFGKAPLRAHRLSWELYKGEIPKGLCVCHRCDNPSCVNPEHLFLATHQDNMQDMVNKKRRLKVPDRWRSVKGANPIVKLTDDQVRSIRQDTRTLSVLADVYDVDVSTISKIKNRRRRYGVSD